VSHWRSLLVSRQSRARRGSSRAVLGRTVVVDVGSAAGARLDPALLGATHRPLSAVTTVTVLAVRRSYQVTVRRWVAQADDLFTHGAFIE